MNKLSRYIGFDDIEQIKNIIIEYKLKSEKDGSYIFIDKAFPNNVDCELIKELTAVISSSYSVEEKLLKNIMMKYGVSINKYEYILKILDLYIKNEKNINKNMAVNFIAKMILWLKNYLKENNLNYNILYIGEIKKHGVYFLILLYFCGYEVMYITLNDKDEFIRISNIDEYSVLIKGSKYLDEKSSKIDDILKEALENRQVQRGKLNLERKTTSEEVSYISDMDLSKFLDSIEKKEIESFYNAFIGSSCREDEYKNILGKLRTELNKHFETIEITGEILPVSNEEINFILEKITDKNNKVKSYIELFKEYFNDDIVFKKVIDEFDKKSKARSVTENFSSKLLIWALRIKDFIISHNKRAVLFFGSIKLHEIYFLKMLKMLNIDIVYIYSMQDFNEELINVGKFKISKGSNFFDIKEIPKKSVSEIKTTAYKAEQQVESIIYNDETGMYRPYQLNSKEITSVILRTTLEEAFILWNEEAKFRSGFLNKNNHVENPVIFLKIDGVYKDIDEYYDMFIKLKSPDNTEVIYDTNIYENSYNNQEYYGANYLFDLSGNIILDKLKKSKYYRYEYLDKSVQNNIISNIQEIINGNYLKFKEDKDFKIRVLLTILSLEERFVRMLQGYDIGGKVPKIILFNNSTKQYSKEDSIIIIFMVLMGVDIVILNPAGYLNIENIMDENLISKFKLETVEYNLEIPAKIKNKKQKRSLFERLFNI